MKRNVEVDEETMPYRVALDTQGCKICGHNTQWCVVDSEGVAMGRTWEDRDEAQWFSEMLNIAFSFGAGTK